ncbi:hypothetical protein CR513_00428, partial [Mucuna pruriens]
MIMGDTMEKTIKDNILDSKKTTCDGVRGVPEHVTNMSSGEEYKKG